MNDSDLANTPSGVRLSISLFVYFQVLVFVL